MKNKIEDGVVHKTPNDLKKILNEDSQIISLWNNLTALARNEWLCFIEDAKKEETRNKRIKRLKNDISKSKKRPCCWPGCKHRNK